MATANWNKKRKLWIIQGQHNGIKKSFYSSTPGIKGKREVTAQYDDWLEFGGVQKITVQNCVDLYLRDIEARLGKRTTWVRVESYARLYILPELGRSKMNNLTLRDWQAVINEARPQKRGVKTLSKKTLANLREGIVGLHKFAYKNYYCDDWRGDLYIPQGHPKNEREILQPSEIARLFEPAPDIHYVDAFRVMLLCGLRPGECYALQEKDVGKGVLYVRRSVNNFGEVTQGKNKNARRAVPMPALAEQIIRETISRNHRNNFGTPWIFCNGSGGLASQSTARKQWRRLAAERDLPGSPYSLRHTFVSIVSSQTHLSEGTIRELVGHSEAGMDTFGTYKHEIKGEIENAAEVINLTFERLRSQV